MGGAVAVCGSGFVKSKSLVCVDVKHSSAVVNGGGLRRAAAVVLNSIQGSHSTRFPRNLLKNPINAKCVLKFLE